MNNLAVIFRNRKEILLALDDSINIGFHIPINQKRKINLYLFEKKPSKISYKTVFKPYNITFNKNSISFNLGFKINNIDFALNIIRTYKKYFEPIWIEYNNGGYSIVANKDIKLEYLQIRKKNDLILVDNYSTDLYGKIIENCFNDLFLHGTDEEVKDLFRIIEEMRDIKT